MKVASIISMAVLFVSVSPVMSLAAVDATSATTSTPVAPGATVSVSMTVTLTSNDDWRSTRVRVSVPGDNNDIETCVNLTQTATTNGTHTRSFSFTAPDDVGSYTAEFRAYENSGCGNGGNTDTITAPFTVSVNDACGTTYSYTKTNDFSDYRVGISFESSNGNDNGDTRIDVFAKTGYEIVDIWLEVEDVNVTGYDLHFASALNNYNPNPGDSIEEVMVVVKTPDCAPVDTDGDGIADGSDNCVATANSNQSDTDEDGTGNACDSTPNGDSDGDGVDELADNCPGDANVDQADTDEDGIGDECDAPDVVTDEDNDSIEDDDDNCPAVPNVDQLNSDGDAWGNLCDEDPFTGLAENLICEIYEDLDMLPLPDFCDDETETPADADEDGIPDAEDTCPNDPTNTCNDSGNEGEGDGDASENQHSEPAPKKRGGHINAICDDMIDNDNDGLYDMNDPGCDKKSDSSEADPVGGIGNGEVAGASCGPVVTSFLGLRGAENDPEAVKAVQEFLNKELGLSLEVNGEYDAATIEAVKAFQTKYLADVLSPWGIGDATGIVYLTTQRMINMISCPGLELPMPDLE